MLLNGWKEIASYLGCGVRTVQRWERKGLPIKRPVPGKRAHVLAQSEQLHAWVHYAAFWRKNDFHVLANVERAQKLRAEVQQARRNLHLKMDALRKEMAALRENRRKQTKTG